MNIFFNNYYDIKEIKRDIEYLTGGLSKVAKELDVERIGTMHQAGSDSLVTCGVYFKLKDLIKKWWGSTTSNNQSVDPMMEFNKLIYGLGKSANEDAYIEEYKALALEYSSGPGKLTNMNAI